ncbi:unnamed protein product [Rangifer tarandus platyrhynchus]|uniref:Uncharacterized protein n=1 Tax=Rangifer tarandus platyrhynchus TaxID=3082113 RepID=A0AC59ZUR0_RANTA
MLSLGRGAFTRLDYVSPTRYQGAHGQAPGLCALVVTSSRRKPMAPDVHRSPAPSFPNPRTQNPASSPLPAA